MRWLLYCFLILIGISHATTTLAQGSIESVNQPTASIRLSPESPQPNSEFTLTVDDYSLTGRTGEIIWQVNGTTVSEFNNLRSITLTTPEVGTTLTITARIGLLGGQFIPVTQIIAPTYIDIVIEPQTRTPSFYLGRSLPSRGSTLRATAVVTGLEANPATLTYTWRLGGEVIGGGGLRGASSVLVPLPRFGQNAVLSLDIVDSTGRVIGSRNQFIAFSEPKLLFYETSTLYGVSTKTFKNFPLTSNSATLQAEPYYLGTETFNDPSIFEWQINNKPVENTATNPYQLTVSRSGLGGGSATVELHVRDKQNLGQGAENSVEITF